MLLQSPIEPSLLAWSKLASAKWEDAWIERLLFLGPGRVATFRLPGSTRVRIDAYGLSESEGARLIRTFGGRLRPLKSTAAILAAAPATPPLRIRGRLVVVRTPEAAAALPHPGRPVLVIPAAMAFGTGDHATTATCLRMLCDFAAQRHGTRWEALDLGTGTGILALAARLLGSARCDAWDFDPAAVRATRENTRMNNLRNVTAARVDVTQWTPVRQWDLVTANLFSDLLVKTAPRIASAVKPGGHLILSGMLAAQSRDTLAIFRALGLEFPRIVKRGKWVTAMSGPAA